MQWKAKVDVFKSSGEVENEWCSNIRATPESFIRNIFFETNYNLITANIKNLIFFTKRKSLVNWVLMGALTSINNDFSLLSKSIEISVKRSYKYYATTARRFLFKRQTQGWTTDYFRNNNMLARLHFFFQRGTKAYSRIKSGLWFKNMYLISRNILVSSSRVFVNNFIELQKNYTVSRFLQNVRVHKQKESDRNKLEYIQQPLDIKKPRFFQYENFFYNKYSVGFYARVVEDKNINYGFYEVNSQDVLRVYKEYFKTYKNKKHNLYDKIQNNLELNLMPEVRGLRELVFHLRDFLLKKTEKRSYRHDFFFMLENLLRHDKNYIAGRYLVEPKDALGTVRTQYFSYYKEMAREFFRVVSMGQSIVKYKLLTKYLHKIKVRFQRICIVSGS